MHVSDLMLLGVLTAVVATAPQKPPAVDPCSLVTRAEAEAAIGKLKAEPKSRTEEQVRICEYVSANGTDAMELWVFPESGLERARSQYKDLKPISDLSQPAFVRRNPTINWVELFTRKGEVTLEITMKATPGADQKVKDLAQKALARM